MGHFGAEERKQKMRFKMYTPSWPVWSLTHWMVWIRALMRTIIIGIHDNFIPEVKLESLVQTQQYWISSNTCVIWDNVERNINGRKKKYVCICPWSLLSLGRSLLRKLRQRKSSWPGSGKSKQTGSELRLRPWLGLCLLWLAGGEDNLSPSVPQCGTARQRLLAQRDQREDGQLGPQDSLGSCPTEARQEDEDQNDKIKWIKQTKTDGHTNGGSLISRNTLSP